MKIKKVYLTMLLVLSMLFLFGCSSSYKINLYYEEGDLYKTIEIKEGKTLEIEDPIKEGYTFDGWYLNDTKISEGATFNEDCDLIAKFTINKYTYKFIVDGKVIKEEVAEYGTEIEFPKTPTKTQDKENKYVFEKWDNDATVLNKDEVFNAVFTAEARKYEYSFMDEDGTIIKEDSGVYGANIVYPEDPQKSDDEQYVYTFVGWDRDDKVLTESVVFIAQYDKQVRQYTYKFVLDDGTILKEDVVDYGTMPEQPTNVPAKPSTDQYKYLFVGWDKTVSTVKGDIVYTAVYNAIPINISLEGKTVSILGDSISTFYADGSEMNSYYGGENQFFYPRYSTTIKTVDKTWWYQLIKNNDLKLGVNNSWSGSCAIGTGSSAGASDGRINTIDDNGMPDIVIIFLGTNDVCSGYSVSKFEEAIRTMITKINKLGSTQIFLTTLGYVNYKGSNYTNDNRLAYNNVLRKLASEYGCGIVPLDEYLLDDTYMFYLEDSLHYNAKGATLLSKIYEKSIKEFNNIDYTDEIIVEHKEKLPEGVLAKIEVTKNTGFWTYYETDVFMYPSASSEKPTYSTRIEIKKNTENNTYYVSNIYKSGETGAYNSDYVIIISDSHKEKKLIVDGLSEVKVGTIVQLDESMNFPMTVLFTNENYSPDNNVGNNENNSSSNETPEVEGKLHVGAYNEGIWTKYESTAIIYSNDLIDKASTFINFYVIKLTKESDNKFKVAGLKTVDVNLTFDDCDYYVLIYRDLSSKTYYDETTIGDVVTVEGDITSGNCYLVFE